MTGLFARQPLATLAQLSESPSSADGVSAVLESDLRAVGAFFIQQAGILLGIPQVVTATAAILFQRFWFTTSLKHFGVVDIALSSLFLSSKLEEHPLRIRDLINAFHFIEKYTQNEKAKVALDVVRKKVQQVAGRAASTNGSDAKTFKYEPMDYFAKGYYDAKEETVIGEMQILKRLGFNLTIQHSYSALVNYLQVLGLADKATIVKLSWGFCNDALMTPLYATFPPTHIAAASIYLACLYSAQTSSVDAVVLPMAPKPWWELFGISSSEQLCAICRPILELYRRWGSLQLLQSGSATTSIWHKIAAENVPLTKSQLRERLDKQTSRQS